MIYQLSDRFIVKSDLQRTWDFFSRAENLPKITPAWMRFKIETPGPIVIQRDTILDYTIRWMGIPIGWKSQIIDWSPPGQFIDLQLRGPYVLWHHQHSFEQTEGGTLCSDRVNYQVPGWMLGRLMNVLVVRRQLLEIFEYRRKVIAEELGGVREVEAVSIKAVEVRGKEDV